jgi:hypothetical protein
MDGFTLRVGAFFAQFVDIILMYGLKWIPMPTPGINEQQQQRTIQRVGQGGVGGTGRVVEL